MLRHRRTAHPIRDSKHKMVAKNIAATVSSTILQSIPVVFFNRVSTFGDTEIREANKIRNRAVVVDMMRSKSDSWFYKSYRMNRSNFYDLLRTISPLVMCHTPEMAVRSSGYPLDPEILLASSLRWLGSASYIDLVDLYKLPETCAHMMVFRTYEAIDKGLDNIKLPSTEEEWHVLRDGWSRKCIKKFGFDLMRGTVLSGDGWLFFRTKPSPRDTGGNAASYWNRKGYALNSLGFTDANCMIKYAAMEWVGSNNDAPCYTETHLYDLIRKGDMPDDCFMVLDEAFCASGAQEVTPFNRTTLQNLRTTNPDEYGLRSTFNYLLSFQRCTIERVWGMMMRKFPRLAMKCECSCRHMVLIFMVCCKLHNVCVQAWLDERKAGGGDGREDYADVVGERDLSDTECVDLFTANAAIGEQNDENEIFPRQPCPATANTQGPRRALMVERIRSFEFVCDHSHM